MSSDRFRFAPNCVPPAAEGVGYDAHGLQTRVTTCRRREIGPPTVSRTAFRAILRPVGWPSRGGVAKIGQTIQEVRISSFTLGAKPLPKSIFGYDVIGRVGEGAHSVIYSVSDPKTKQLYALKHVVPVIEKDQKFIDQLDNEFALSKLFRHGGLRKSVDLKKKKKWFGGVTEAALIMEMVDGKTLDEDCPRDNKVLVDIFVKAGQALAALHHMAYVHCDMKPGNVMRLPDGRVKIIDFGQACKIGTVKERLQGTPDFIAPEQVRFKQLNVPTDVYNLGATLYWALTGKRVPTLFTVAKADRDIVREQKYPAPSGLNPFIPEELSKLVMECVRLSPAYRPQTMAEVIDRLKPFGPG